MTAVVTPAPATQLREEREQNTVEQERQLEIIRLKSLIFDISNKRISTHITDFQEIVRIVKKIFDLLNISYMIEHQQVFNSSPSEITYDITNRIRYRHDPSTTHDRRDFLGMLQLPSLKKLENMHIYNVDPSFNPDWNLLNSVYGINKSNFHLDTIHDIMNSRVYDHAHALFTIGSIERYVYAIIGVDGILYFIPQINNIYSKIVNNLDLVYNFYEKPLNFQNTTKMKYTENPNLLSKDLLTLAILRLTRDTRSYITNNSINQMIRALKKIISSFFEDSWVNENGTSAPTIDSFSYALLMNQSRVYRDGIYKILTHNQTIITQAYNDGLNVGMKLFSNMASCGFHMDETIGKWVKDVEIIPWKCYWKNTLWKIKPEYRKWKLTRLTIDSRNFKNRDLLVTAIGTHPNVSSDGYVCLGDDLLNKWNRIISCDMSELDPNTLPYFFNQIEETLQIINFDSPYQHIGDIKGMQDNGVDKYTEDHSDKISLGKSTWVELD